MQMWHEETVTIIEQEGKQAGVSHGGLSHWCAGWYCNVMLGIPEMADPAFNTIWIG